MPIGLTDRTNDGRKVKQTTPDGTDVYTPTKNNVVVAAQALRKSMSWCKRPNVAMFVSRYQVWSLAIVQRILFAGKFWGL